MMRAKWASKLMSNSHVFMLQTYKFFLEEEMAH